MKKIYKIDQYIISHVKIITSIIPNYIFTDNIVRVAEIKRECVSDDDADDKPIAVNYSIVMRDGSLVDTTGDNQLIKDILKESSDEVIENTNTID